MLGRRFGNRANSFYDGGLSGGNACRAKILVRSRFVLDFRGPVWINIARVTAAFVVAGFW